MQTYLSNLSALVAPGLLDVVLPRQLPPPPEQEEGSEVVKAVVLRQVSAGEDLCQRVRWKTATVTKCLAVTHDGSAFFAGMEDGRICSWKASGGQEGGWETEGFAFENRTFEAHAEAVNALVCCQSSSDVLLFSGSADTAVILWNVAGGCPMAILRQHRAPVNALAVSSVENRLYSASDDGTILMWQPESRHRHGPQATWADLWASCQCKIRFTGHNSPVRSLSVAKDSEQRETDCDLLVSGSTDGAVAIWSPKDKKCVFKIGGHHQAAVTCIANAENTIFTASEDKFIRYPLMTAGTLGGLRAGSALSVFDLWSGRGLSILEGHTACVRTLALASDKMLLLSGSDNGELFVWSVADPEEPYYLHTLKGHKLGITSLAVSWHSDQLWSASADQSLVFWQMQGLPHHELAKAIVDSKAARIKELVSQGIVVPSSGWDHALSAEKAVAGHQLLMDSLSTAQKQLEERVGGSNGVLKNLRRKQEQTARAVGEAGAEVSRLNKAMLELQKQLKRARENARSAQRAANKAEGEVMAAYEASGESKTMRRLSRGHTLAMVSLERAVHRHQKLELEDELAA